MGKENMLRKRIAILIDCIATEKTNGDRDKAVEIMYKSKTYKCLKDVETGFYLKSVNEIRYLMRMELAGNEEKWNIQAWV